MERIAPAGDVYQAGTLSGNPLAVAAGLATLEQLDAAAYERLGELTDRLAAGFAELAADRPLQVAAAPGPRHPLLQPGPGHRLRHRDRLRHRGPRRLLPGAARARRLPAPGPVRGLVRLPRPRRGADRPDPRSRRRGPRMNALQALAEQLRAEDTPISPHVVDPTAAPELGDLAGGGEYALVVEAVREGYLLHYGRAAPARRPRPRPRPARRRLPLRPRPRPPRRPRRHPRRRHPRRPDQPLRPPPRRGRHGGDPGPLANCRRGDRRRFRNCDAAGTPLTQ